MEQIIRDKVLQLDTSTGSVYDFSTHLPYPTLQKIYDDTGINLILLEGSTHQAESKVKLFVRKAFQLLVYSKVEKTNRDLEYLIATDLNFRTSFTEYVINLIGDIFVSGNSSILMMADNETSEQLKQRAKFYHSGILDANRYDIPYYNYRVGY